MAHWAATAGSAFTLIAAVVGLQAWMGQRQVHASRWTRVSLKRRSANWSPLLDALPGGLAFGLVATGTARVIDND